MPMRELTTIARVGLVMAALAVAALVAGVALGHPPLWQGALVC